MTTPTGTLGLPATTTLGVPGVLNICLHHLTYMNFRLHKTQSGSILSPCKTGREVSVQRQPDEIVWSVFNYFSHCSLAFVVLHADALPNGKDPIVCITASNEYALVCLWRWAGLVHCILYSL